MQVETALEVQVPRVFHNRCSRVAASPAAVPSSNSWRVAGISGLPTSRALEAMHIRPQQCLRWPMALHSVQPCCHPPQPVLLSWKQGQSIVVVGPTALSSSHSWRVAGPSDLLHSLMFVQGSNKRFLSGRQGYFKQGRHISRNTAILFLPPITI